MAASSAVHSNAFSFLGFLEHQVDARTGMYTAGINLPTLNANMLCGPSVPLALDFNPLNLSDTGFGLGWRLKLSQFTPGDRMLALSSGETFKVTGSGPTPDIAEKKVDTFHFHVISETQYEVVHKSGTVEILEAQGSGADQIALPVRIYSAAGHWVTLTYGLFMGKPYLNCIKDQYDDLLHINTLSDNLIEILVHPYAGSEGGPLARYELRLVGRELR